MEFRTELILNKSKISIDYASKLLFLGSCFSDQVGNYLKNHGFHTLVNPFGTTYNPISISKILVQTSKNQKCDDHEILYNPQGFYFHHDFHSKFNGENPSDVKRAIDNILKQSYDFLKNSTHLFITLGTAWVYTYEDGGVVSNCHKMPAHHYTKKLLSYGEVFQCLGSLIEHLSDLFPALQFIFTLSPVRHTKDGLVENSLSKATCLTAIHSVVSKYPQATYFPAYELMMDDLRDYRFYASDLIHPSEQGVAYIIEKFSNMFLEKNAVGVLSQVDKHLSFINHKALLSSADHEQKVNETIDALRYLIKKYEMADLIPQEIK